MDNKCNYYGKTGSCRNGKRSISDKRKQPQRGLGVARLEKLRMQNEIMANFIASSQSNSYQNGFQMGHIDASSADTVYSGFHQAAAISSSVHGEPLSFSHNVIGQSNVALPLFGQSKEDSSQWNRNLYNYQASSTCYHYYQEDTNNQDVDLELRLAL